MLKCMSKIRNLDPEQEQKEQRICFLLGIWKRTNGKPCMVSGGVYIVWSKSHSFWWKLFLCQHTKNCSLCLISNDWWLIKAVTWQAMHQIKLVFFELNLILGYYVDKPLSFLGSCMNVIGYCFLQRCFFNSLASRLSPWISRWSPIQS